MGRSCDPCHDRKKVCRGAYPLYEADTAQALQESVRRLHPGDKAKRRISSVGENCHAQELDFLYLQIAHLHT
jgi:hypothetical protein